MKHIGTKTLETDRLILRKIEAEEAKIYASVYYGQENISQPQIESLGERLKYFSAIDKYYWGIVEKHSGNLIGEVLVFDGDDRTRSCVLAYEMSVNSRNKGYTTEAVTRVLPFLILEVGYNRISSGHQADNPASGRVMQKSGMKYEGTLRQDFVNKDGTLVDSILYSMIRQDLE